MFCSAEYDMNRMTILDERVGTFGVVAWAYFETLIPVFPSRGKENDKIQFERLLCLASNNTGTAMNGFLQRRMHR
jgi:hypothetical protein